MQAADKNLTTLVRLILPLVAVVVFATTWAFIGLESPWTARAYAELRNNSPIYFWAMYLIMLGGVAINYPSDEACRCNVNAVLDILWFHGRAFDLPYH
jgi:hypothetical protein